MIYGGLPVYLSWDTAHTAHFVEFQHVSRHVENPTGVWNVPELPGTVDPQWSEFHPDFQVVLMKDKDENRLVAATRRTALLALLALLARGVTDRHGLVAETTETAEPAAPAPAATSRG